jgi:hypothetical protein
MDPQRYQELRARLQSLSDQAVRMTMPDGASQSTMKNRILRVAAELTIPVTIRRVPGGVIFWRSTDEDIQQAQEVRARLQTAQAEQPQAHSCTRARLLLTRSGGTLYSGIVAARTHGVGQGYSWSSSPFQRSAPMDTPPCW